MIEPSDTYDLSCSELNDARANALVMSFWECKDVPTWNQLSQRAYWMLCAFWNGNRPSYDNWHGLINDAVDECIERLSFADIRSAAGKPERVTFLKRIDHFEE